MVSSPSSPAFDDEPARNTGTVFSPIAPLAVSGAILRAGFELLAAKLFPKIDPDGNGLVVAAATPATKEWCGGLVSPPGAGMMFFGVVGRHSETTFALPSDEGLSLRHGILIARITDDGCPILRALDLRSGTGMYDADGMPHRSIVTNGPLRLRLGNSALFAIPSDRLFRGGGLVPYDDIDWPAPQRWLPEEPPERRLRTLTDLSRCSTALSLEPRRRERLSAAGTEGPGAGRFVVESQGGSAVVAVDETALRTGVLVGRYPRCDINAGNAPMTEAVSRVHALFLEMDGGVRVFDTGSTNGIGHEDRYAGGIELPPGRETRLLLGSRDSITWHPAG